jgi:ankyrin repeat protein
VSRDYLSGLIAAGDKSALLDALDNPVFSSFASGLDSKGRSLLHDALEAGFDDLTAPLMAAGAKISAADPQGNTPLHLAAERGMTAAVQTLLHAGAAVDIRAGGGSMHGPDAGAGDTPLHRAAAAGHADIVRILLARGADPALTSPAGKGGRNAWHMAAEGDSLAVLDLLLAHPDAGRMNDFCDHGKTRADAFRLALKAGHAPIVRRLISHGIDINRRDSEGHTPLHWLLLHRSTRAEALPMVRLLLQNGADGDKAANLWGETPLMVAAKADFPEAMYLLLDQGADAARRSQFLETALHFAAHHYTAETIHLLIDAGADINAPDRTGQTALHIAAHHNRRDVVKTLIARGADPTITDARGRTPDRLCLSPVQVNTQRLVLKAQEDWARKNRKYGGRLQRKFNPSAAATKPPVPPPAPKEKDINAQDRDGQTALHIAARNNNYNAVRTLLSRGADPLVKDRHGRTADHHVRTRGKPVHRMIQRAQQEWAKNPKNPQKEGDDHLRTGFARSSKPSRHRPDSPAMRRGAVVPRPFGKKPPSNDGGNRP